MSFFLRDTFDLEIRLCAVGPIIMAGQRFLWEGFPLWEMLAQTSCTKHCSYSFWFSELALALCVLVGHLATLHLS